MKIPTKWIFCLIILVLAGLAGCRIDQSQSPEVEETQKAYVGSSVCGSCHSGIYSVFLKSGHPFKLTKVENGQKPIYPFSVLPDIPNQFGLKDGDNTLGPPQSYFDVSYVIGGYYWKARFIDTNGYIITGSDVQFNFESDAWAGYHDDDVDKPYNCGKCHTTGWLTWDENGNQSQDNLPGMAGTFTFAGIQCEACHGEGKAHADTQNPLSISKDDSSELCGKCHTRDSKNRIEAKGDLIRHHEQYDELLGINPDNVEAGGILEKLKEDIGCNSCHNPHATTVYQKISGTVPGVKVNCETCHPDKIITAANHQNQDCITCHMPKMVKSAVSYSAVGSGPKIGDIRAHIFRIDLSKTDQFTSDGKFSYPWITGKFACKSCHNGVDQSDLSFPLDIKIHL